MKSFTEYLKDHAVFEDGTDIACIVSEYLEDYADETEKNEPYATRSIEEARKTAKVVYSILTSEE